MDLRRDAARPYERLRGTTATYGRGAAVVTATGMRPEMGRIAGLLKETREGDAASAPG